MDLYLYLYPSFLESEPWRGTLSSLDELGIVRGGRVVIGGFALGEGT